MTLGLQLRLIAVAAAFLLADLPVIAMAIVGCHIAALMILPQHPNPDDGWWVDPETQE